jgi:hypothetical protein
MESESMDLGLKPIQKSPKREERLEFQVKVGASRAELQAWAELAAEAGFRPKAQKVFKPKPHGFAGEEEIDQKGIGRWIREVVIPDYQAHAWEREQQRVDALRMIQEGEAKLAKLGGRRP